MHQSNDTALKAAGPGTRSGATLGRLKRPLRWAIRAGELVALVWLGWNGYPDFRLWWDRPAEANFNQAPGRLGPVMVVIPAGSFTMGSPADEAGRSADESPQHEVSIAKPFALGRYEVTFDEYDEFARATGRELPDDQGWGRGRRPVINVSWNDAKAYAEWLSKEARQPYRLPSEAEWEYAARGRTKTAYSWGEDIRQDGKVWANCYACGSRWDNERTAPVGSFPANPWGLQDMIGNVWEWVEDCYYKSYEGAPVDGSARVSGDCASRVLRGGSWYNGLPENVRAAYRTRNSPGKRYDFSGFRLARDLP